MNWLLYISGWFIGWAIFNTLFNFDNNKKFEDAYIIITIIKLILWTMLWVWICWRFL